MRADFSVTQIIGQQQNDVGPPGSIGRRRSRQKQQACRQKSFREHGTKISDRGVAAQALPDGGRTWGSQALTPAFAADQGHKTDQAERSTFEPVGPPPVDTP